VASANPPAADDFARHVGRDLRRYFPDKCELDFAAFRQAVATGQGAPLLSGRELAEVFNLIDVGSSGFVSADQVQHFVSAVSAGEDAHLAMQRGSKKRSGSAKKKHRGEPAAPKLRVHVNRSVARTIPAPSPSPKPKPPGRSGMFVCCGRPSVGKDSASEKMATPSVSALAKKLPQPEPAPEPEQEVPPEQEAQLARSAISAPRDTGQLRHANESALEATLMPAPGKVVTSGNRADKVFFHVANHTAPPEQPEPEPFQAMADLARRLTRIEGEVSSVGPRMPPTSPDQQVQLPWPQLEPSVVMANAAAMNEMAGRLERLEATLHTTPLTGAASLAFRDSSEPTSNRPSMSPPIGTLPWPSEHSAMACEPVLMDGPASDIAAKHIAAQPQPQPQAISTAHSMNGINSSAAGAQSTGRLSGLFTVSSHLHSAPPAHQQRAASTSDFGGQQPQSRRWAPAAEVSGGGNVVAETAVAQLQSNLASLERDYMSLQYDAAAKRGGNGSIASYQPPASPQLHIRRVAFAGVDVATPAKQPRSSASNPSAGNLPPYLSLGVAAEHAPAFARDQLETMHRSFLQKSAFNQAPSIKRNPFGSSIANEARRTSRSERGVSVDKFSARRRGPSFGVSAERFK
jgi:hypothetical protein